MGTRGAVGIRFNDTDKVGYNHYDSYPDGLGDEVLEFIKNLGSVDALKKYFYEITFEKDDNKFTEVWDCDNSTMKKCFTDNHGFLHDSLFCEYAYIVNLDTEKLEFYIGFNKNPNAKGRYAFVKKEDIDKAQEFKLEIKDNNKDISSLIIEQYNA